MINKENKVYVIDNPKTNTFKGVDAKDLILDTSAKEEKQKKLGTVLNEHTSDIKALKEENKALKKSLIDLTKIVNSLNLKTK